MAAGAWPQDRYLSFSNLCALPPIAVLSASNIEVGKGLTLNLAADGRPGPERKTLAAHLGLPVALVDQVFAAQDKPLQAEALATSLRSAVIDFRFLLAEWTAYTPDPAGQPRKDEAIKALVTGDLRRSWALYKELPWPVAPRSLRIVQQ